MTESISCVNGASVRGAEAKRTMSGVTLIELLIVLSVMAVLAAVKVGSADATERRRAVSAAKAYVGQQARFVGQQAVQLHGGMGVTDELNVAHFFKRLTLINATFGDADHHLGRFSELLLAA